ncbi:MAG TPA: hypothetical protein VHO50_03390 [Bacteroidales bacterium]|nr:hypothetical protein [Bacteroidales bacterium]
MVNFGTFEIILIVIVGFGILSILPLIFYLITLQNTLLEVRIENRKMQPGMVWLTLIPLFGIIWQFIIVNNVADSLKLEFQQRNLITDEDRPGYSIGLAFCILACCSIVPFLGFLTALAAFICWIMYWVKISSYKTKLKYSKSV